MPSGFYNWSQTAATNASADSTINYSEGQAPSSVNDSARAMMAVLRKWGDDISGAIVTGGTSTGYTVASYSAFDSLPHLNGQMIAFTPHATNGATVTLNCDGLGAKPLRAYPGVELPAGSLILGTPYIAVYNSSDAVFYLRSGAGGANAYSIPLGAGLDYWGSTTPNSIFAFPAGQAISRTTYATLFTLVGTTYGTGDGSTTFNLPNKAGKASFMKEATATLLTSAGGGLDGGTLGAFGGSQGGNLAANQIPSLTSVNATQAITVAATSKVLNSTSGGIVGFNPTVDDSFARSLTNTAVATNVTSTANNSISVAYTNSSQVVSKTVPPGIVCNYIIRVL